MRFSFHRSVVTISGQDSIANMGEGVTGEIPVREGSNEASVFRGSIRNPKSL